MLRSDRTQMDSHDEFHRMVIVLDGFFYIVIVVAYLKRTTSLCAIVQSLDCFYIVFDYGTQMLKLLQYSFFSSLGR